MQGKMLHKARWRVLALVLTGAVIAAGLGACGSAQAKRKRLVASCSTRVSATENRSSVAPMVGRVPGSPYAVVATGDGRWFFSSVSSYGEGEVAVMRPGSAGAPRLVHTVPVPQLQAGFGLALARAGSVLLMAGYDATAVLDVRALETGRGQPLLGVLRDGQLGQIEVTVSPDGRYAFVTNETSGTLSVFDLALGLRKGFGAKGIAVGSVPLAPGPVGVAASPDGRRIYVTTFVAYGDHGLLWVLDAGRAEYSPGRSAVLGKVSAGCQPVRVALSPSGGIAWVTALQSNVLLGFDTSSIVGHPSRSLRAIVHVGSEPVGLLLVDHGRLALVGNSNRGLVPGSTGSNGPQTISVVNTARALSSRPSLVSAIPTGLYPRDMSYDTASNEVLLANYNSDTIELFKSPTEPAS